MRWFRGRVLDVTGVDLAAPPEGPPPWDRPSGCRRVPVGFPRAGQRRGFDAPL